MGGKFSMDDDKGKIILPGKTGTDAGEEPDRLFDGEKLVFDWDKCAFAVLLTGCLQPVLTAAAQIIHPSAGAVAGTLLFYLPGVASCIICLLYLLDRINYEKGRFFLRIWKDQRWNVLFSAVLILGGISVLLSDDTGRAFMGSGYRMDGYLSYILYAGFYGCAMLLCDKNKILKLLKIFAAGSVILGITSLAALIPFVRSSPNIYLISLWYMRGTSVFQNLYHYGYYLVMAAAVSAGLFLYGKKFFESVVWFFAFLLNIWVLTDNGSLTACLAVFLCLVLFALRRRSGIKSLIPLASFLLAVAGLLLFAPSGKGLTLPGIDYSKYEHTVHDSSAQGHELLSLWRETVGLIVQKPLFGYGPEGLSGRYAATVPAEECEGHTHETYPDRPQNEYLQHAAFMGVPALLLYLSGLIMLAVRRLHAGKNARFVFLIAGIAAAGYLISAVFGNTMYYTTPIFFMLLGFAANKGAESTCKQTENRDAV